MSDLEIHREEIVRSKEKIEVSLRQLPTATTNKQSLLNQIEAQFRDFSAQLDDYGNSMLMFDTNDQYEAKRLLDEMKREENRLRDEYNSAKNREMLLSGVSDTARDQIGGLVGQRQLIEKGDQMVLGISRDVNRGIALGNDIVTEINKQNETLYSINDNLNDLDTDVEVGNKLLDKMICRQKRRNIFMIIIIIILLIAACVFLYFIFK